MGAGLVPVDLGSFEAISIRVGDRHACAVDKAGAVKCWGDNTFKQLGDPHPPVGVQDMLVGNAEWE
eukprot:1106713-Rhodomonas_salina.1